MEVGRLESHRIFLNEQILFSCTVKNNVAVSLMLRCDTSQANFYQLEVQLFVHLYVLLIKLSGARASADHL